MRGFSCVALHQPKTHHNVGSILRLANNFDVRMVTYTGRRYEKAPTDTGKFWHQVPLLQVDNVFDAVPMDCVPIGVELCSRGNSLHTLVHPDRALYIFGPEDGSLGKVVLDKCKYVVYIPTNMCMNLAVCCGVVLYDRQLKYSFNTG